MSRGEVAALRRPKIRRSRSACCAWMPAFEPVSKNLANPLCLNLRTTRISVTQNVTGHKTPNARYQPRPKAVGCMPWFDARWDSRLSRSSAQSADHRFDELLERLVRQSRNLSDHQVRAGREQLARPGVAVGAKRAKAEARWCQANGSLVAIRLLVT